MRSLILRCLLLNALCLGACAVLVLGWPRQQGFTVPAGGRVVFVQAGPLFATLLLVMSDLALGIYGAYKFFSLL